MQGSEPSAVYFLRKGKCTVEYKSKTGDITVLSQLHPGDHFGEAALLEGRSHHESAVRCSDPGGCTVGVLGRRAFEAYLAVEPHVAEAFEKVSAQRYSRYLRTVITMAAERQAHNPRCSALVFDQLDSKSFSHSNDFCINALVLSGSSTSD